VAQGLVRFDAAGQIEPGIAERWIVTDEGRSYIFRLRAATWSDGRPVTAADVATILRRQIAPASRNPLKPWLSAITSIVEMTPQIIEIELSRPRPDLLKLFAQPELSIFRTRPPGGSGPFRVMRRGQRSVLLSPVPEPDRATDEQTGPVAEENVRLIGERAARAIVRFSSRKSDLVTGGTIRDWPLVGLANASRFNVRIDPAAGLFGLAIVRRDGFLADAGNRVALAEAIDRAAVTTTFSPQWAATESILPDQLDSAAPAAVPVWTERSLEERRTSAAARVRAWRTATEQTPQIRLALPGGPGGTMLWVRLAESLFAVGISPLRVGPDDVAADVRLIDAVAPYDSARWYLATACQPCGETASAAIEAARIAPTLAARSSAISAADAALAEDTAFIPIARPFRWSLVALRLRQWQPNARAWHPLNRLRRDPN